MLNRFRHIIGTAATAVDIAYKLSQGLDYKTLNKYILRINRLTNVKDILYEASRCLGEILNYDLFAYGIKNVDSLDIWVDPRIHNDKLFERIREDLESQNSDITVNYFDDAPLSSHYYDEYHMGNMLSFPFENGKVSGRLYLLPGRKMLRYHYEIMEAVVNAVGIALEHALNLQKLENAAFIDMLTGCYNRRALDSYIDHDIADAQRYGRELAVIMFDIDYFKKINDNFGHQAGDSVLAEIAGLILSTVRKSDYLGRYGGEEFMLVLPNTGLLSAVTLAERLRKKIGSHGFAINSRSISVTASFGVSVLREGFGRTELFRDADNMLYKAKAWGRNNVMHEEIDLVKKTLFLRQSAC